MGLPAGFLKRFGPAAPEGAASTLIKAMEEPTPVKIFDSLHSTVDGEILRLVTALPGVFCQHCLQYLDLKEGEVCPCQMPKDSLPIAADSRAEREEIARLKKKVEILEGRILDALNICDDRWPEEYEKDAERTTIDLIYAALEG